MIQNASKAHMRILCTLWLENHPFVLLSSVAVSNEGTTWTIRLIFCVIYLGWCFWRRLLWYATTMLLPVGASSISVLWSTVALTLAHTYTQIRAACFFLYSLFSYSLLLSHCVIGFILIRSSVSPVFSTRFQNTSKDDNVIIWCWL